MTADTDVEAVQKLAEHLLSECEGRNPYITALAMAAAIARIIETLPSRNQRRVLKKDVHDIVSAK